MRRQVFRWLRRKLEPYLGEGVIRGIDLLRKAGLNESMTEALTDGAVKLAPKLLSLAEKKLIRAYSVPDRNPETINPTFDVPPPPTRKSLSVRDIMPDKFTQRRHQAVDQLVNTYSPPATFASVPPTEIVENVAKKRGRPAKKQKKKRNKQVIN